MYAQEVCVLMLMQGVLDGLNPLLRGLVATVAHNNFDNGSIDSAETKVLIVTRAVKQHNGHRISVCARQVPDNFGKVVG